MPIRSKAQRRWLHHAVSTGKMPPDAVERREAHTDDAKLPERVGKSAATVGNTTPLLKPIPSIPTPVMPKPQLPQKNNPQAALAQQQQQQQQQQPGAAAPPQQPIFGWQPGTNGQTIYTPGQGPVSGQVAKSASLGQRAAARFLKEQGEYD